MQINIFQAFFFHDRTLLIAVLNYKCAPTAEFVLSLFQLRLFNTIFDWYGCRHGFSHLIAYSIEAEFH